VKGRNLGNRPGLEYWNTAYDMDANKREGMERTHNATGGRGGRE
jgi:hypothetical protein